MSEREIRDITSSITTRPQDEQESLGSVIPLVYDQLRRIAHHRLRGQSPGHSLQTTDLVHEAYLRLSNQDELRILSRGQFFALSALLMRQILIEYARKRNAAKRNGGQRVTLDSKLPLAQGKEIDFEALDEALRRLAELDTRQAQIVELRFFGGLSIEESAEVLGISAATVKRDWLTARVWLHKELAIDHQGMKRVRVER